MENFPKDILDLLIIILPLGALNKFRLANKRIYKLVNEAFTRYTEKIYPGHLKFLENEGLLTDQSPEHTFISIKHYYKFYSIEVLLHHNNYIGTALYVKKKPDLQEIALLAARSSLVSLLYLLYKQHILLQNDIFGQRLLMNAVKYKNYAVASHLITNGITIPNPLYFVDILANNDLITLLAGISTPREVEQYNARIQEKLSINRIGKDPRFQHLQPANIKFDKVLK